MFANTSLTVDEQPVMICVELVGMIERTVNFTVQSLDDSQMSGQATAGMCCTLQGHGISCLKISCMHA